MPGLLALVLALLALVFVGSALFAGRRQLRALVRVVPGPLEVPLVVIMPARNEAARIGASLRALLADPAPLLRVVVVDDRSDDDTGTVAARCADARAVIVTLADDPPAGQYGKPRALQAGVEHARTAGFLGARVLFVDADVALADGALGGIVRALDDSGADALSGVPRLVCASAVEALFVPALASIVTGRFAPTRVHDDADATAFLNGQLIAMKTSALDDVGGWSAVSGTVLEDVALAGRLKARHHPLRLADLRAAASTRMYDSFAALDEGFGKNATALLGRSAGIVGLFALVLAALPWIAAIQAARALLADPADPLAIATLIVVAAVVAVQTAARRLGGAPLWPVLVLPLVYGGAAWVLVRASWRAFTRAPIAWRGRRYPPAG